MNIIDSPPWDLDTIYFEDLILTIDKLIDKFHTGNF